MKFAALITLLCFSSFSLTQTIYKNDFEQKIAIRTSELNLVDPHINVLLFDIICTDLTDQLNSQVQASLSEDANEDGYLDTNIITQFSSDQPEYITSRTLNLSVIDGRCPAPLHSSACEITSPPENQVATTFNQTDNCLIPIEETTSGYDPAPNIANAPCYATLPVTSSFNLAGTEISLQGFQESSRYLNDLILDNGLRMGFVSEEDAENITFPESTPIVGGQTLASLLPGGMGNCSTNDDRDLYTDGITSGWWFYFNTRSEIIELQ
ncbi:MAG: hypothetical protein AB8B80_01975 [Marinicellaceae bacterium]